MVRGTGSDNVANSTYRIHLGVKKSDTYNLASLWPALGQLALTYAKYSILRVSVRSIGLVPTTSPAVIVGGYDPQDDAGALTVANVMRNRHHYSVAGNGVGTLVFSPQQYVEDWLSTSDPTSPSGAFEIATTYNSPANTNWCFNTYEFVVAFGGLRE